MNKKKIGEIQILLGIVIFILAVSLAYPVFNSFYIKKLVTSVGDITGTWSSVGQSMNMTYEPIRGHVISSVYIAALSSSNTWPVFWIGIVNLIVLSAILILQGLANIGK